MEDPRDESLEVRSCDETPVGTVREEMEQGLVEVGHEEATLGSDVLERLGRRVECAVVRRTGRLMDGVV